MKVRVLGTKEVDYTNRNGQRIQGVDIYGAFKDAIITGEAVDRIFISDNLQVQGIHQVQPGATLDIQYGNRAYNNRPMVVGVDILSNK